MAAALYPPALEHALGPAAFGFDLLKLVEGQVWEGAREFRPRRTRQGVAVLPHADCSGAHLQLFRHDGNAGRVDECGG